MAYVDSMESLLDDSSNKKEKKRREVVFVTNKALQRIAFLLNNRDYLGIRIKVLNNRGCYGKKYHVEYAKVQDEFDEVISKQVSDKVVKVFIDAKTVFSILGSTVDYVEDELSSGFVFVNPRERGRCGCGKSFY